MAWISFHEWPMTKARSASVISAPSRRMASTTDSTFSRSESTSVPSRSNRIASGARSMPVGFYPQEPGDVEFLPRRPPTHITPVRRRSERVVAAVQ